MTTKKQGLKAIAERYGVTVSSLRKVMIAHGILHLSGAPNSKYASYFTKRFPGEKTDSYFVWDIEFLTKKCRIRLPSSHESERDIKMRIEAEEKFNLALARLGELIGFKMEEGAEEFKRKFPEVFAIIQRCYNRKPEFMSDIDFSHFVKSQLNAEILQNRLQNVFFLLDTPINIALEFSPFREKDIRHFQGLALNALLWVDKKTR